MDINGLKARPTEAVPAIPASCLYEGQVDFNLADGEKVKVDGAGVKQFEGEVPQGKKWEVSIRVSIKETDA